MLKRHVLPAIAALGLAAATILLMPSHGETNGWRHTFSPSLQDLTGSHPVGARRKILMDASRRDPWAPATSRELMVDVHYPAAQESFPLEHYYLSNAATELGIQEWAPKQEKRLGLVADEVNWQFRTHGHEWAPVADGSYPVLLLSAGPERMRTSYRGLAEELASHGYIVVSIDHPYDSAVVEFYPKRRVVEPADAMVDVPREIADETRARDIEYVAGHLADVDAAVARAADQEHVGLLGWTGVGTPQLSRLRSIAGVHAIASIGGLPSTVDTAGAGETPLLMIAPERSVARPVVGGWRALVSVQGSTARGLTDDGLVLAQIAHAYPRVERAVEQEIGTAPATAVGQVVHKYVRAFFDAKLRGRGDATFEGAEPPGATVEVSP